MLCWKPTTTLNLYPQYFIANLDYSQWILVPQMVPEKILYFLCNYCTFIRNMGWSFILLHVLQT